MQVKRSAAKVVRKTPFVPSIPEPGADGTLGCEAEAAGELAQIAAGFTPTGEAALSMREREKRDDKRRREVTDSEYWVCLCFGTRAQKQEFLAKLGFDYSEYGDKHIDGLALADLMGIAIESPDPDFRPVRMDPKLSDLT